MHCIWNAWVKLSHDPPRSATNSHRQPRPTKTNHDQPRSATNSHDQPRTATIIHEQPRTTANNHDATNNHDQPRPFHRTRARIRREGSREGPSSPGGCISMAISTDERLDLSSDASGHCGRRQIKAGNPHLSNMWPGQYFKHNLQQQIVHPLLFCFFFIK